MGHAAIYNGYATDLFKTGEIICSTGSTAGIMFFSPTVTYPDNTTEPAEPAILPYPVFEGGKKAAIQRGAGMCIIKSTEEKEKLAAVFLKWFTRPENNLRFVASTGYLPVTVEAYGDIMSRELETISDENIKTFFRHAGKCSRSTNLLFHRYSRESTSCRKNTKAALKELPLHAENLTLTF